MPSPLQIMLVDDDPMHSFVLKLLLKRSSRTCETTVYGDGEAALQHFTPILQGQVVAVPHLILLDLNMPILDGWGFLDQFMGLAHKLPFQPKLCILSSSDFAADRERAQSYSLVSEYLVKPVSLPSLEAVLAQITVETPATS